MKEGSDRVAIEQNPAGVAKLTNKDLECFCFARKCNLRLVGQVLVLVVCQLILPFGPALGHLR